MSGPAEPWDGKNRRQSVLSAEERSLLLREVAEAVVAANKEPRFMGFRIQEIFILGAFLLTIGGLLANFKGIQETNKYLAGFAANSDAYHSAATGLQFKQGAPANSNYDRGASRQMMPNPGV